MPKRPSHHPFRDFLRGQSLIEVIIATGLLAIIAASFFIYTWSQLNFSNGTGQSLETISVAQEGIDAIRTIRDQGWSSVPAGTYGLMYAANTWTLQGTSDTSTGYIRTVTITDLSATERQVIVTVQPIDPEQNIEPVTLSTILTNWQNATPPTLLSGDWSLPQTLSKLDIGLNTVGTGVVARNKIAYMTGTGSSDGKDFYVIDATSSTHPVKVASVDTGPGLNALAVNGNFAYAANNYTNNQLQILNISGTTTPYLIGAGKTLTGNTHAALSIAATGTLVLVGTALDNGPELYLVDATDPAAPVIKSSLEVKANINRISILGNRAFLATASTTAEFIVVNIANPNVPVITKRIDLASTNAAKGVYVNPQDHRAYIVRARANGTSPELYIYDATNQDSPTFLASKELTGNIYAAMAADSLLFLGTDVTNLGIQIYDITNLPTLNIYSSLNPLIVNDISFDNNIFYGSLQGVVEELVLFTSK